MLNPMMSGCSMLAMILSWPAQRPHRSISIPNTRLRRFAQVIAACLSDGLSLA